MHPLEPQTSPRELWSFYLYNMALAAVGQFALVLSFPLILEGLARRAGHLEHSTEPCPFPNTAGPREIVSAPCFVELGVLTVRTDSFASFVFSLSVILQAFIYISIASFGDYGHYRKKFLIFFGIMGALTTMSIPSAFKNELFWLEGILMIAIIIFHGASYVFLDGYFPILVRNDPKVVSGEVSFDDRANEIQNLSQNYGFGFGLLIQIDSIFTLQLLTSSTGIWWIGLGSFAFFYLLDRPGPNLPSDSGNYIFFSWKVVFKSFKYCTEIPNTFLYLGASFFFSDGIHTLAQTTVLFCSAELGLGIRETALVAVLFPIFAIIGNLSMLYLQKAFHFSTKSIIISCLAIISLLPVYALIGNFNTTLGLVHQWEAYMLAGSGFFFGPVTSFGKVLFAELIPEGSESEFFALCAISDRGSSWIGPLVVGGINQATNNFRYGMGSISVIILAAIPLLYKIDVEKGRKDAKSYALKREEEESLLPDASSETDVEHTFHANESEVRA